MCEESACGCHMSAGRGEAQVCVPESQTFHGKRRGRHQQRHQCGPACAARRELKGVAPWKPGRAMLVPGRPCVGRWLGSQGEQRVPQQALWVHQAGSF